MPPRDPDILGRFWAKVDIRNDSECWPWRSERDDYGRFPILPGFRAIGTHRFSWILANRRDIPDGLFVMHSCDNKRCVNPAHLSLGTSSDNTKDAVDKGLIDMTKCWSGIKKKDRCKRGHELTPDNVYANGTGRKCKRCHKAREAQRRQGMKYNNGNPNGHDVEWVNG